jgi:hypothetical protein
MSETEGAPPESEPLKPALEPGQPGSPQPASEPPEPLPTPSRAAYLPFGAYAQPSVLTPAKPAWTRTYELPSARRVVSAGLQLAQGSSRQIRRASVYIGLLALGAFGPAAILVLVGLGRLMSDPETAATLTSNNPFLLFAEQPEIGGPLALIYAVSIVGFVLLIAISIDAEAMAIAILGGAAAERPLRLEEAVRRARQTFWRLFGSGLLVGLGTNVLAFVLSRPFLRPLDTNQGVSFIASTIATLVFTPFAFAATGIVLGDAGVIEALRRSFRLFRARPRIALVVTLFTLVTAAIQAFALGSGVDLASRVADFFHVGQGAASLILPGILVLAFIVAFGSLTFTIAAIVAAPQVAAFLGLTFYSAGLDLARTPAGSSAPRVRWVSVPMTIAMAGLAVVALVGLPTIVGFHPRPASPLIGFLRDAVNPHGVVMVPSGPSQDVSDPRGDVTPDVPEADIVAADMAALDTIPDWFLDELFKCGSPDVACGTSHRRVALDEGAILFAQRMAGPSTPTRGGGHYEDGSWREYDTTARSAWRGDLLVTIVPFDNINDVPRAWDAYAWVSSGSGVAYDNVRPADGEVIEVEELPSIRIFDPAAGP